MYGCSWLNIFICSLLEKGREQNPRPTMRCCAGAQIFLELSYASHQALKGRGTIGCSSAEIEDDKIYT